MTTPVELPSDWDRDAEMNNFDHTKVWSCAHYIAENSYGFSSSHPDWSEEKWVAPLQAEMLAYHGPAAARTVQTLVDFWGCEQVFESPTAKTTAEDLLRLAIVQSEYHRGVRT